MLEITIPGDFDKRLWLLDFIKEHEKHTLKSIELVINSPGNSSLIAKNFESRADAIDQYLAIKIQIIEGAPGTKIYVGASVNKY